MKSKVRVKIQFREFGIPKYYFGYTTYVIENLVHKTYSIVDIY